MAVDRLLRNAVVGPALDTAGNLEGFDQVHLVGEAEGKVAAGHCSAFAEEVAHSTLTSAYQVVRKGVVSAVGCRNEVET